MDGEQNQEYDKIMKKQTNNKTSNTTITVNIAWLYSHGYTLRSAGLALGVTRQHLAYVLRGERKSFSLIEKVKGLPKREEVKPRVLLPEIR